MLPKPDKGEPTDKFISRCMGEPIMKRKYRDRELREDICRIQVNKKGVIV